MAAQKIGGDTKASTCVSWFDQFRTPAETSKIKNSQARALFDNGRTFIDADLTSSAAEKLANYFFDLAAPTFGNQTSDFPRVVDL